MVSALNISVNAFQLINLWYNGVADVHGAINHAAQVESCMVILNASLYFYVAEDSRGVTRSSAKSHHSRGLELSTVGSDPIVRAEMVVTKVLQMVVERLADCGCRVKQRLVVDQSTMMEQKILERLWPVRVKAATGMRPTALELTEVEKAKFEEAFGMRWSTLLNSNRVYNAAGACNVRKLTPKALYHAWRRSRVVELRSNDAGGGVFVGRILPESYYIHLEKKVRRQSDVVEGISEEMKDSFVDTDEGDSVNDVQDIASAPSPDTTSSPETVGKPRTKAHDDEASSSDGGDDDFYGADSVGGRYGQTARWDDEDYVNRNAIFCVNGHIPYLLQCTLGKQASALDHDVSLTVLSVEWDAPLPASAQPSSAPQNLKDFMDRVIGCGDPSYSHPESLVRRLHHEYHRFGLDSAPLPCDAVLSCSGSALQAMADRRVVLPGHNLFTDHFGSKLLRAPYRFRSGDIDWWLSNPVLSGDAPLFQKLFGLGTDECGRVLHNLSASGIARKI
jgi:hypothetical protein